MIHGNSTKLILGKVRRLRLKGKAKDKVGVRDKVRVRVRVIKWNY